ncbi:hypothetical protein PVAP13_4KG147005 [Panicum virgatum]|uniref:Uncharacterized protein n=1 Tax=Panicum virgatum TaxID=38727 RepID=A0A8T0TGS6_PANVG|nr:hypothetical protein PVAP13_4KG147005 [Panicum virgatum]
MWLVKKHRVAPASPSRSGDSGGGPNPSRRHLPPSLYLSSPPPEARAGPGMVAAGRSPASGVARARIWRGSAGGGQRRLCLAAGRGGPAGRRGGVPRGAACAASSEATGSGCLGGRMAAAGMAGGPVAGGWRHTRRAARRAPPRLAAARPFARRVAGSRYSHGKGARPAMAVSSRCGAARHGGAVDGEPRRWWGQEFGGGLPPAAATMGSDAWWCRRASWLRRWLAAPCARRRCGGRR